MPIRTIFNVLQLLALALACFGGAYYFSGRPRPHTSTTQTSTTSITLTLAQPASFR